MSSHESYPLDPFGSTRRWDDLSKVHRALAHADAPRVIQDGHVAKVAVDVLHHGGAQLEAVHTTAQDHQIALPWAF